MIETNDYIVSENIGRSFWQFWKKRRKVWLVVGYYTETSERQQAIEASDKRAAHVAKFLTDLPVKTKVHLRGDFHVS